MKQRDRVEIYKLKMNRAIKYLMLFIITHSVQLAIGQNAIQGKITDSETGEDIILATVALYQNDTLITGVESDFDGNYSLSDMKAGTYSLEITYIGYTRKLVNGIIVSSSQTTQLDLSLKPNINLTCGYIYTFHFPLIEFDEFTRGSIIRFENNKPRTYKTN